MQNMELLLAGEILKKNGYESGRPDNESCLPSVHHDESAGGATDLISAALIIADKTDVRQQPGA